MLPTRRWFYFTYEIQTPLLERPIHYNRAKGQGFELLLPYKSLALVTGPQKSTHIRKKDWPIVPYPQDLVGCGFPIMMAPTCVGMKVMHDLI